MLHRRGEIGTRRHRGAIPRPTAAVDELFEAVTESELDPELRDAILDRLESIRRAIVEYRVHGTKGLRNELHTTLGVLLRRSADMQRADNEPLRQRVIAFIIKADGIIERGQKYGPLLQAVALRLLGTKLLE